MTLRCNSIPHYPHLDVPALPNQPAPAFNLNDMQTFYHMPFYIPDGVSKPS